MFKNSLLTLTLLLLSLAPARAEIRVGALERATQTAEGVIELGFRINSDQTLSFSTFDNAVTLGLARRLLELDLGTPLLLNTAGGFLTAAALPYCSTGDASDRSRYEHTLCLELTYQKIETIWKCPQACTDDWLTPR